MKRLLLMTLLAFALHVNAQETTPEADKSAEEAEPVEAAEGEVVEDDFELDVNTDHTEEDEDVFKSSEKVLYQQSLPFPVDI